jgi:hypothetical protein
VRAYQIWFFYKFRVHSMCGFPDLCDIVFEHSLTKAAGMQRPDLLMSGKVAPPAVYIAIQAASSGR